MLFPARRSGWVPVIGAGIDRKTAVSRSPPDLIRFYPRHKNINMAIAGHVTDGRTVIPVMGNLLAAFKEAAAVIQPDRLYRFDEYHSGIVA